MTGDSDGGSLLFFFNDTAPTEIYTLSLHDALPIFRNSRDCWTDFSLRSQKTDFLRPEDRKSTRLNSSHVRISYAVFCLKKEDAQPAAAGGSVAFVLRRALQAWGDPGDRCRPEHDREHDPGELEQQRNHHVLFFIDQEPTGLHPLAQPGPFAL